MLARIVLFALCAIVGASTVADAADREALIIGNGAYRQVPRLPNPSNDADDMAAALKRLNFNVQVVKDASYETMRLALLDFAPRAQQAEMAVVFYAGHGIEVRDENWLIPVDANLKLDITTAQEAIALRNVVATVSLARKLGLVLMDACRDNPFLARLQSGMPSRSISTKGLAAIEPPGSVIVMFAAKHGTAALDGQARNSPFTAALLGNIEVQGLELNFLFRNVRDDVLASTGQRQEPFLYGSLSREPIYFSRPADPRPAASAASDEAARAWKAIENTISRSDLETFIRFYDRTFYADLARARLSSLQSPTPAGQVSAAAPQVGKAVAAPAAPPAQEAPTAAAVPRKEAALIPPAAPAAKEAAPAAPVAPPKEGNGLVGLWSWSSACGIGGNYQGQLRISAISGGQLSGVIFDKGQWELQQGRVSGSSLSFRRRTAEGSTQHWTASIVRPPHGPAQLRGTVLDSRFSAFGSCSWRATLKA